MNNKIHFMSTLPTNNQTPDHPEAEWVRLPKAGPAYRFWGLSRTTLTELCLGGQVRSICIKKRGAQRGIRLIYLPSLREFLFQAGTKQQDNLEKGGSNV